MLIPDTFKDDYDLGQISVTHSVNIASFYGSISQPIRLKILGHLSDKVSKFQELRIKTNVERTALSHHLDYLKRRKLVKKITHGTYNITNDGINLLNIAVYFYMKSELKRSNNKTISCENIEIEQKEFFLRTYKRSPKELDHLRHK